MQKNITSVEQLRGKILGMSASGSLTDILLREGLRLNGVAEKDVTIIPVGDLGARLSGLQTGRIHGGIIAGVQTLTATRMGFEQLIDYFSAATGDFRIGKYWYDAPMSTRIPKSLIDF